MTAWFQLIYKEYRMTRALFLLTMVFLILVLPWTMIFFPAIFMLISVSRELKNTPHLWLHCPQPAWMLLSAKLVVSIVYMLIVLLITSLLFFGILLYLQVGIPVDITVLFITAVMPYVFLFIIGASIYMAAWGTLMAVASATARNILGRFDWLAAIATFFIGTWGMAKLYATDTFQMLTQWGAFNISFKAITEMFPAQEFYNYSLQIFGGQIIAAVTITLIVFALSAWLIDNKVEV